MVSWGTQSRPLRRSVLLPLCFGLAVVTGIALLVLATSIKTAPSIGTGDRTESGNQLDVRQFYEAVNRVLGGGNEAALAHVVAPELLAETGGLIGRLTTLRQTYPDLRFTVESLVTDGDVVVAQITAAATRRETGRGLVIEGPPLAWRGMDRFRFEDGLIVRYSAGWEAIAAPDAGWTVTLDHPPDGPTLVAVVRFTFAPGAWLPPMRAASLSVLYVVESGQILAESSGASLAGSSAPATPSAAGGWQRAGEHMHAGDHLILPAGISVGLANDDRTAAVVLGVVVLTFAQVPSDEARASETVADQVLAMYQASDGAWHSGLTVRGLAATVIDKSAAGPIVVAGDPLVLAPGETIGRHRVNGVEFVVVEAGSAGLMATSPDLQIRRAVDNVRPASPGLALESGPANGEAVALLAGDAAAIVGGTVRDADNAGETPLSLMVVTITPVDDRG